ncbi:MAG: hypothetical protein MZV63_27025 [Marinilabiliales bacterium]|nr:hypothetical protein [Marinilabiliales bacterium]
MKRLQLAFALFLLGLVGQPAWSGNRSRPTCPLWATRRTTWTDRSTRARTSTATPPATGSRRPRSPPAIPTWAASRCWPSSWTRQLLALIQQAAATTGAPKGSPRQQVGDFYKAAMDSRSPRRGGPAAAGRPTCSASPRPPARRPTTAHCPPGCRTPMAARR